MSVRSVRPGRAAGLAVVAAGLAAVGCQLFSGRTATRQVPLPPGVSHGDLIDADNPGGSVNPLDTEELSRAVRQIRESRRPAKPPDRKYEILCLSGGGVYGSYTAGVLVGWSDSCTRPRFDVVTGISAGALIAPLAFLGPEFDAELRRNATALRTEDVYERRPLLRSLFAESLADNTPLRRQVEGIIRPEVMARIAAEHAAGRRLYVGSTNLDTRRLTVWDVGAIASRGTPDARALIVDVMLASSAIPAFFPSVRIPVTIDGVPYEELHVDGAVTRSLFFRPPAPPPGREGSFGPADLYDSNLYAMVAGKLFQDPEAVRPRTFQVALAAVSSLLYAGARGDLARLFNYTVLTGMNFYVSAIPKDLPIPASATEFDPEQMTKLFNEGYVRGREGVRPPGAQPGQDQALGAAWRDTRPGLEPGEQSRSRSGTRLVVSPPADRGGTGGQAGSAGGNGQSQQPFAPPAGGKGAPVLPIGPIAK